MSTFLITMASGEQSSAVTRSLLSSGQRVHALVRNPQTPVAQELSSRGAVLYSYTPDTPSISTLKEALSGTTGLFLNTYIDPSHPDGQLQQIKVILQEAVKLETPPRRVVISTAFHTGKHPAWAAKNPDYVLSTYYAAKLALEEEVRKYLISEPGGFVKRYTILRPAWLMHNYLLPASMYHFPGLSTQRVLAHAYKPGTKMPHFAAADLGGIAALALTAEEGDERFEGTKVFELGYENLSVEEAAATLSKVAGVDVGVRRRTEEEAEEVAPKVPTQVWHIWSRDHDISVEGGALRHLGVRLTTLEEFLVKNKGTVKKSLGLEE